MQERNRNVIEYREGKRFRLEIATANLMRCEPQFAETRAEADRMRKQLRKAGYSVTLMYILGTGGLSFARQ